MYEFYQKLNIYLLTYIAVGKSPIDVFNRFVHVTKHRVAGDDVVQAINDLNQIKELDFATIVADAEMSGAIPTFLTEVTLKER